MRKTKEKTYFTFHRVGWTNEDGKQTSGWLCLIKTEEHLKAYLQWRAHDIAQCWLDIKNSPDKKPGHCKTTLANVMKTLLDIKMTKENKTRISMVEAVNYMEHELTKTVVNIFCNEGEVYANSAGGYRSTHLRDDHKGVDEEIFESCVNKDFVFPTLGEDEIKISKWFVGKHYYISVNGRNVEVDGVSKWSTIDAAEEAKENYIRRNRYRNPSLK